MIYRCLFFIFSILLLTSFSKTKEPPPRIGKDHAVFFAVKDYQHWDQLSTPIKDAKAIANQLSNNYGFTNEILENPTWLQVRNKLAALKEQSFNPGDQLLLFFTGHGEFVPSRNNAEQGKGYFIPVDAQKNDKFRASYLYYPDIKPEIDDILCERILVVIDACYSGSFLQYRGGDDRPGKKSERDRLIQDQNLRRCRKGITSGGLKRTPDGIHHSPFAERFLQALNSKGGDDQVLTYNELFTELEGLSPAPSRGYFGEEDSESKFLFIAPQVSLDEATIGESASREIELAAWRKAEKQHSIQTYQSYLIDFPNGIFQTQAQQNINAISDETDWQIALTLNTEKAYQDYLERHPNGVHIKEAMGKTTRGILGNTNDELTWLIAVNTDNIKAYLDYLDEHPNGNHSKEATQKIKELNDKNFSNRKTHKVANGETFYQIAKTHGISVKELIEINKLTSSSPIYVGQVIFVE